MTFSWCKQPVGAIVAVHQGDFTFEHFGGSHDAVSAIADMSIRLVPYFVLYSEHSPICYRAVKPKDQFFFTF